MIINGQEYCDICEVYWADGRPVTEKGTGKVLKTCKICLDRILKVS